jgi:8-amino-7-oxononanoate synthase
MNTQFNLQLQNMLNNREHEGMLRHLKITNPSLIDFSSNDYLGLAQSVELRELIEKEFSILNNKKNGATGSRLLTGNTAYAEAVEQQLATFFNSESTLVFNSGYTANLAVLSSISKRGDTVLYDELAHASIKDGMRLSLATRLPFKHNDLNDLERKLKMAASTCYIVVESVYSMDGDSCPLHDLVLLAEKYNASIILDEAHSTGVIGKQGKGLACSLQLEDKIAVRVYTFGKAMGIHGACVAGSANLIQYLINFARPFIYTTALNAHTFASIVASFKYLNTQHNLQQTLQEKVKYFLSLMQQHPQLTASNSAIQSFVIPGNEAVRTASGYLQHVGLDVRAILSPTVSSGAERLRIILHTFNTNVEIEMLVQHLHALSSQA